MNSASGSHLWELWELGFGTRGFLRCEAEGWVCGCSGGVQPFGNKKQQQQKRDSAWKLPGILCVNLISKPFDPLFTYSAANPEKHPSPCLIWVKQLILLGVKYRCEALIQPSGNVMAWPEPRSPNYPRSKLTKSNHSGEKRSTTLPSDPSSWNSVTPVYSASVK